MESKFNIGDNVWFFTWDETIKVIEVTITDMLFVEEENDNCYIGYHIKDNIRTEHHMLEHKIYKTYDEAVDKIFIPNGKNN